jgi:hypothetical protein
MARAHSGALNNVPGNSSNNDATLAALFKPLWSMKQGSLMRTAASPLKTKAFRTLCVHRRSQYLHAARVAVSNLQAWHGNGGAAFAEAWRLSRGLRNNPDDGMVFAH